MIPVLLLLVTNRSYRMYMMYNNSCNKKIAFIILLAIDSLQRIVKNDCWGRLIRNLLRLRVSRHL